MIRGSKLINKLINGITVAAESPGQWLTDRVLNNRLKDGLPATTRSARYLPHGYSLIIKDVTPEDAGIYKILLSIKRPKMFKSFTVTLIVNGKFMARAFFGL